MSTFGLRTNFSMISATVNRLWCQQTRSATKKAGGSSRNGRDSEGRRLGVKKFGGEVVQNGTIIIRQRGQKYRSGLDTKMGRDHSIYSVVDGYVLFVWDEIRKQQTVTVSQVNPNIPPQPKRVYDISLTEMRKLKSQSGIPNMLKSAL